MPSATERQQITEALHKALLFNLIIEAEQDVESSDSSSGTSDDVLSPSPRRAHLKWNITCIP